MASLSYKVILHDEGGKWGQNPLKTDILCVNHSSQKLFKLVKMSPTGSKLVNMGKCRGIRGEIIGTIEWRTGEIERKYIGDLLISRAQSTGL